MKVGREVGQDLNGVATNLADTMLLHNARWRRHKNEYEGVKEGHP